HKAVEGRIRVGLVGASSFAQGVHLPNLRQQSDAYSLRAVMSRTGANARAAAEQYVAKYSTTDEAAVLADPDIDHVIVASRHDRNGASVLAALRAGKNVFVEQPLTTDPADLAAIEDIYGEPKPRQQLPIV